MSTAETIKGAPVESRPIVVPLPLGTSDVTDSASSQSQRSPKRRGRPPQKTTTRAPQPPRPSPSAQRSALKASPRARQVAAVVLEVLAGVRTPAEAATSLEVPPVRYFQIETRALAGMLAHCEPAGRGRKAGPVGEGGASKAEMTRLRKDHQRLRSEVARLTALLRTARTAFGLKAELAPPPTSAKDRAKGSSRTTRQRQRKPRVRALRLAGIVRRVDADSADGRAASTVTTTTTPIPS